jgi:hypothetical protein
MVLLLQATRGSLRIDARVAGEGCCGRGFEAASTTGAVEATTAAAVEVAAAALVLALAGVNVAKGSSRNCSKEEYSSARIPAPSKRSNSDPGEGRFMSMEEKS